MSVVSRAPIRRLAPVVADAIAAGEVVERPASVVKELCENAIDAGATRIDVDIEAGGLVRMAVSDDGWGIPADEIALATERHATSKLTDIDGLAAVSSLGFRGEALASIAAVSELEIVSAAGAAHHATRVVVRAGTTVTAEAAARARGTTIEVRDIFFNTPARLRFLKSQRAEAAAAVRIVGDLALTHPEIAVTCRNEGRHAVRSPGTGLRGAAAAVFGPAAAAELLDVGSGADDAAVRVHGCISQPRAHRGTRGALVLVVNGRRVHNRLLVVAVEEAYRGLIPAGRHPYGVVVVEMDPGEVDVNVHPTKREVRFREEGVIFSAVQRACWAALQDAAAYRAPAVWSAAGDAGGATPATFDFHDAGPPDGAHVSVVGSAAGVTGHEVARGGDDRNGAMAAVTENGGADAPAATERIADLAGLTSLGQIGGEWLVAMSGGSVVIVDPHAAHEKILYEQIRARWDRSRLDPATDHVQLLLIPAVVECDPSRLAALERHDAWLRDCGLHIEPFGEGVVRCTAVPAASADADAERLVLDVLDELAGSAGRDEQRRHRVAALIACHSAVRFGDRLGEPEQQRLLTQLAETSGALTCPHGRPTVMILDTASLRRAFRRPAL